MTWICCINMKRCPDITCRSQDSMCNLTCLGKTVYVCMHTCIYVGIHINSRRTHSYWLMELVHGCKRVRRGLSQLGLL